MCSAKLASNTKWQLRFAIKEAPGKIPELHEAKNLDEREMI